MSEINQISSSTKSPLRVGITGGIGSGKTTACRVFEQLGIPVYYSDERAKHLMVTSKPLVRKIKALFGEEAYHPDGSLDRKLIASLVFQNGSLLEKLNAVVHPAVLTDGDKWHHRQTKAPYTLKESAILFEIGSQGFYDKTIVVFAPKAIRVQRVMQRDGLSAAAVEARMDKQMADEDKMQLADYVIVNDGVNLILPQVIEIHRQLLAL
ncbi:MAG: dephospho-CoA kinase [Saprospiraceae bacterium]|nr:dephospho-CoA kinase [Saprospiraceae bacterium]